jgi:hypothetical protein
MFGSRSWDTKSDGLKLSQAFSVGRFNHQGVNHQVVFTSATNPCPSSDSWPSVQLLLLYRVAEYGNRCSFQAPFEWSDLAEYQG